jgi:hypothetical protein
MTRAEKRLWLRGVTAGITLCGFCSALIFHRSMWSVTFWTLWGGWQVYALMFPKESSS